MTPLRVPLQTGAAALLYAQLGGACLVVVGAVVPAFFLDITVVALAALVVVGSLIAVGIACWVQCARTRPSDAILDDDGFAIVGGATRGRWLWKDVPVAAINVSMRGFTELTLAQPSGPPKVLAAVTMVRRSGADRERAALAAIGELLAKRPPRSTASSPTNRGEATLWIVASAAALAPTAPLFVTAAALRFAGEPALYDIVSIAIPALLALSIPLVALAMRATARRAALRDRILGLPAQADAHARMLIAVAWRVAAVAAIAGAMQL